MKSLFDHIPNALTPDEIERVVSLSLSRPFEVGTQHHTTPLQAPIRNCSMMWLEEDWLADKLLRRARDINEKQFQFRLSQSIEMQLVQYRGAKKEHYDWHQDIDWSGQTDLDRKLSLTIQLSCPSSYIGGHLEFDSFTTTADLKQKGSLTIFPAYLRHRVSPVTKGHRIALVAWVKGPPWQ